MDLECKLCCERFKDIRLLSRHLHFQHKDYTKEQYYSEFIEKASKCLCCDSPVKFMGLAQGYSKICKSRSCATKSQWINDNNRRNILSARLAGNTLSSGRPIGSKNKTSYPITDKVLLRIANHKRHLTGLLVGDKNGMFGKQHSSEAKEKMSKAWPAKKLKHQKRKITFNIDDIPEKCSIHKKEIIDFNFLDNALGLEVLNHKQILYTYE